MHFQLMYLFSFNTSAQAAGLLCEEAGNYMDNVKYCGYCHYHYQKLVSSHQTNCKVKVVSKNKN